MSVTDTMLALGILPGGDLRLARPELGTVASTFGQLDVVGEIPVVAARASAMNLSFGCDNFDAIRACLSGMIGKIVILDVAQGQRGEAQVMDLRSMNGKPHVICRDRSSGALSCYAHPPSIPNKLAIPLDDVIHIHIV